MTTNDEIIKEYLDEVGFDKKTASTVIHDIKILLDNARRSEAESIFAGFEKGYHVCSNELLCCEDCIEGSENGIRDCPCYQVLKSRHLKDKKLRSIVKGFPDSGDIDTGAIKCTDCSDDEGYCEKHQSNYNEKGLKT